MIEHTANPISSAKLNPLSKCSIWQTQNNYYQETGISAWADGKIPYYATSNPYIANSYANIIIRFIQDWLTNAEYQSTEPFYIIELGAGSGTFSFYTLKRLCELQKGLGLSSVRIIYVMTDMVQTNIEYWQSQPDLQPYLEQGVLDFARFDMQADQIIHLLKADKLLSCTTEASNHGNPLIVLANYVFDTLKQDIFRVKEGKLQVGTLKEGVNLAEFKDKWHVMLKELDPDFTYQDIALPYYTDERLNAVLARYQKEGQQQPGSERQFLLPLDSLQGIERLIRLAGHKLLLLSTDKGYARHMQLYQQMDSGLVFHDACFSMMVNYDAIGKYFAEYNGDYYHQLTTHSIVSSVFVLGSHFAQLLETQQALITYLDELSHTHLFNLYSHIIKTRWTCSLETIISYLAASHWDPQAFNLCFDAIINQMTSSPPWNVEDLLAIAPKIAANFYYLSGAIDTLANIGILFQTVGKYTTALSYYYRSLQYYGKVDSTLYNMALCYYFLKDYDNAVTMFHEVLAIKPDYVLARGWLAQIEIDRQQLPIAA